jgi:N-acetylneuraminic acid mutarotase
VNRRRIGLVLRVIGYGLGSLVVILAVALAVLRVTNPGPRKSDRWMRVAEMPRARGEVAAAAVGRHLVVAGGLYGIGRTADVVHIYDMSRNEWTRARSLPSPRHHAAAAGLGEHVYISGGAPGATDWSPTDNLWRAPLGLPWRAMARMPEGRQGHAMVGLGGRLYVVGGVGRSDRTLIYDAATNKWTMGAPLPSGRDHLRAVAWRGEVWAIGGRNPSPVSRVDIYDPKADRWRRGPSLPQPMSAMAVGVVKGALHVVGGEHPGLIGGRVIDEHFRLLAGSTRWRTAARLALPVHGAGYGVVSGRLVVAGGAAREGLLSTISWTPITQLYFPEGFPKRLVL